MTGLGEYPCAICVKNTIFIDKNTCRALETLVFHSFSASGVPVMFKTLFDFSKKRTLKESVGFYLFYCTIALALEQLGALFH